MTAEVASAMILGMNNDAIAEMFEGLGPVTIKNLFAARVSITTA